MNKLPWILAIAGVGGAALLLRAKSRSGGRLGSVSSVISDVTKHPAVFGAGAGIANGMLATVRGKPMSVAANLVTASVIGISEGMLSDQPQNAVPIALLSAIGAATGMAAFTRWNPEARALLEAQKVPSPA